MDLVLFHGSQRSLRPILLVADLQLERHHRNLKFSVQRSSVLSLEHN